MIIGKSIFVAFETLFGLYGIRINLSFFVVNPLPT